MINKVMIVKQILLIINRKCPEHSVEKMHVEIGVLRILMVTKRDRA